MAESRDIFIVCNHIVGFGGVPRWAHSMGAFFAERGHRVHLVGLQYIEPRRDYGPDLPYQMTTLHDTPVAALWQPQGLGHLNVSRRWAQRRREASVQAAYRKLSDMFQAARPGAVVIVGQVWAMEWVARANTTGLHVIGMNHESYEAARRSTRYGRVRRWYADVDRFLVLTDEDADAWARDGMSNVAAMPNPLMITPTTLPSLDEKTVLTVGRLHHCKGIDMLLETWAAVSRTYPDWQLKVFGSGPDRDKLHALATELGLDPGAIFQNFTNDLDSALSASSIFVLPSRDEGFPIAIMEAMAYGLPTVAFECAPGVRELLGDEEAGLLAPTGDVPALTAALERLMKDRDLRVRLGGTAKESVRRFLPEKVVDRWEELFAFLER